MVRPRVQEVFGKFSKKPGEIGNYIHCFRGEIEFYGVIVQLRENSAIVEVNQETMELLDIATEYTVVAHKNYEVIKKKAVAI